MTAVQLEQLWEVRRSAPQLEHLEQQREKARSVPPQVEQLMEMARPAAQLLG